MVDPKEEEWLKRALNDCFANKSDDVQGEKNLRGLRILISNLVKNIEKNLSQIQTLWERKPESKELRERFYLLRRHLFYLRRFCEGKIKPKHQKNRGGKDAE